MIKLIVTFEDHPDEKRVKATVEGQTSNNPEPSMRELMFATTTRIALESILNSSTGEDE
jgi:hypothetical protein